MCTKAKLTRRSLLALGFTAPMLAKIQFASASNTPTPLPHIPIPGDRDACPVCGMFPARYPDWIATVLYQDGHADHFDGAKDLFKYCLDMEKYASGRKAEDIAHIAVTDYYATERIDARKALFVMGSDVLGPMGHELVPHPDRYDAEEFLKDHQGKGILTFDQVTVAMLLGLDKGEFILP